jgi:hypothetical protein
MRTPDEQARIEALERMRSQIGYHRLALDLKIEPTGIPRAHQSAIRVLRRAYAAEQGPLTPPTRR